MSDSVSNRLKSTHARYAARAAEALGFRFRSLDGAEGYLFEVRDGARKAMFAAGAGSPFAFNDMRAASLAKDKAFAAVALREAGLPAPPHELFFVTRRYSEMRLPGRELQDARAFAQRAIYPLFCKPVAASAGQFAERIDDADAFEAYLRRVGRAHFAILVQPLLRGREYRVIVLDGRALFAYEKSRPKAIGDGRSSVRTLGKGVREAASGAMPDPHACDAAGREYRADDVPEAGVEITFDGPANRAAGGGAEAPREDVRAPLAELAISAAKTLGLRFAGVDVFDLSENGELSALCVIEVNSNPMFQTLEDFGRWDLIIEIWRTNFEAALK